MKQFTYSAQTVPRTKTLFQRCFDAMLEAQKQILTESILEPNLTDSELISKMIPDIQEPELTDLKTHQHQKLEWSLSEISLHESFNEMVNCEILYYLNTHLDNHELLSHISKYRILQGKFLFTIRLQPFQQVHFSLRDNSHLKFGMRDKQGYVLCNSNHTEQILVPESLYVVRSQLKMINQGKNQVIIGFYLEYISQQ